VILNEKDNKRERKENRKKWCWVAVRWSGVARELKEKDRSGVERRGQDTYKKGILRLWMAAKVETVCKSTREAKNVGWYGRPGWA
jgi:hypothetical protein